MKNLLMVLAFLVGFTFAVNAQSKDCCSKEKGETTKVEKSTNTDQTLKTGDKVETASITALTNNKESLQKETSVTKTKMNSKENCDDISSCCDMKKEKKTEKVEKEVEKK
jgi:hypothetical protein